MGYIFDSLLRECPRDPRELCEFFDALGLKLPGVAKSSQSRAPMAYVVHSFFEGAFVWNNDGSWHAREEGSPRNNDCVVWANRGGGKTFLGAVVTMLDLVFKPGIEVRILAGSSDQAMRMYEHLTKLFEHDLLKELVDGKMTKDKLVLKKPGAESALPKGRSRVEVLSSSQASVRGVRIQKLRCDEVDLFDDAVWNAAQLVTRTAKPMPGPWGAKTAGAIEVFSTMHEPGGLMQRIVEQSRGELANGIGREVFRWGVVDVLERCGDEFACEGCGLFSSCGSWAKQKEDRGFVQVGDALVMRSRVGHDVWESEMACSMPRRQDCVYEPVEVFDGQTGGDFAGGVVVCGMDFGIRSATAIVWGVIANDVVHVVDEYVVSAMTMREHVAALRAHRLGLPKWIGVDPAGGARNDQTGVSNIGVLRDELGLEVRQQRMSLSKGIELVRGRIKPAEGRGKLVVSSKCVKLLAALASYRYRTGTEEVVKDGHDHVCDALRYMIVGLDGPRGLRVGRYW
jgi:hypothetical protein